MNSLVLSQPNQGLQGLPFKLLVLANVSNQQGYEELGQPKSVNLNNIDQVISDFSATIRIDLLDARLARILNSQTDYVAFEYPITKLQDLDPYQLIYNEPHLAQIAELIDQINAALQVKGNNIKPEQFLFDRLNLPELDVVDLRRSQLELLQLELSELLSKNIDVIIHDPAWQAIESAWRSIYWLLIENQHSDNFAIDVMSVDRELMWQEMVEYHDLTESDVYHHIYQSQLGQYGAAPYSAVIVDEYFDASGKDISLMNKLAEFGQLIHAPVIASISPLMLGCRSFSDIPAPEDLTDLFNTHRYLKYRKLLEKPESSFLVLTLPKIKLRQHYQPENNRLAWYHEATTSKAGETTLFGNAAFAFVLNMARSFEKHGLCTDIVGQEAGKIDFKNLYDGHLDDLIPVELMFSEVIENALTNLGFTALCSLKSANQVYFRASNSIRWGQYHLSGKNIDTDIVMSCNVAFLSIALRFAHQIKVLFREQLGQNTTPMAIQSNLNRWLQQYVSEVESPSAAVMAKRPLKRAKIEVLETKQPGWFDVGMTLMPHFSNMADKASININLSLNAAA